MGLMKKVGDMLGIGKKKEEPKVDKQKNLEEQQKKVIEQQKAIILEIKEKTAEIRGLKIELKVTTDKNDQALLKQNIELLKAKGTQLLRKLKALGDVVDIQLTAMLVEAEAAFMEEITDMIDSAYNEEKTEETMTQAEVRKEMMNETAAKAKAMRKRLTGSAETEEEFEFEAEFEAEEVEEIEEEEENA